MNVKEKPAKPLPTGASPEDIVQDEWFPFACEQCGMGPCPARAHVVNGVVIKVEGNPEFRDKVPCPSLVCVKAMGLVQKLYYPYRIKGPLKRTNPKKGKDEDPGFVEISWDEALDIIVKKLEEIRAKGVMDEQGVPRVSAYPAASAAGMYNVGIGWNPFWVAWGPIEKLAGGGGVKCVHAEHVYGEAWRRAFVNAPDFSLCNYVIMFGRNQNVTTVQLGASGLKAYADAKVRGMKHIHVAPALSGTAAKADEWIPIKMKTDDAFLFAMIHIILHEMDWQNVCDIDFLKKMTNSPYLVGPNGYYIRDPNTRKPLVWDPTVPGAKPFDEAKDFALGGTYPVAGIEIGPDEETYTVNEGQPSLQLLIESVKNYTPEWASAICGVPAETIRRITREFVEHAMVGATVKIDGVNLPYRPVCITLGRGVNNGWGAYACVWSQHVLLMLMGALEVPGSSLGCLSLIYRVLPFEADSDGFLLALISPTDKERWEWPPQSRHGSYTLSPLAGPAPSVFPFEPWKAMNMGPDQLPWKSFVEPLENWPSSTPEFLIFGRTDLVGSMYDSNLIRRGMEKIPFTVHVGYAMNESNWYADVILPEAIELEGYQIEEMPSGHKGPWEYYGWAIRQRVVEPLNNVRDATDIYTELAERLGMLDSYNAAINSWYDLTDTPFALSPQKKYTVEEIMDHLCRAVTNGEHDLAWFKKNGAHLSPISKLHWYLHREMTEKGCRYQLPYQGAIKKAGEELKRRLHEVGISWWDRQAEEYAQGLPTRWEDSRRIYEEVYEAGPEYDMWLTCHNIPQLAWSHNANVPWIVEASEDTLDGPGVLINPVTARKKGIKHGDRVCLESKFGKTTANAIISETVAPDVLTTCQHFGSKDQMLKKLGWPNSSETERMDIRLIDASGSSSMHPIVKVYKV